MKKSLKEALVLENDPWNLGEPFTKWKNDVVRFAARMLNVPSLEVEKQIKSKGLLGALRRKFLQWVDLPEAGQFIVNTFSGSPQFAESSIIKGSLKDLIIGEALNPEFDETLEVVARAIADEIRGCMESHEFSAKVNTFIDNQLDPNTTMMPGRLEDVERFGEIIRNKVTPQIADDIQYEAEKVLRGLMLGRDE